MKYWSDATSFEAHVRSQSEKSSLVGCALDVSAATAQQFSGFSSFSDAEVKFRSVSLLLFPSEELRQSLPPAATQLILTICERHGVRDAFQARREAVNLKKVALGVQWEATSLEHSLLRLALICFVGDTSVDPRDYARGNVYTPCAAVSGQNDAEANDLENGIVADSKCWANAKRGSGSISHDATTPSFPAQTLGHSTDEFLALDEWGSALKWGVDPRCKSSPEHPATKVQPRILREEGAKKDSARADWKEPPKKKRPATLEEVADHVSAASALQRVKAIAAVATDLRVYLKRACKQPRHPEQPPTKAHCLPAPEGFRLSSEIVKARTFLRTHGYEPQTHDMCYNDAACGESNGGKNRGDVAGVKGGDDEDCGFAALLDDLRNSRNVPCSSGSSSLDESSEAAEMLGLSWVAEFVEKVLIARGVYKAFAVRYAVRKLALAFETTAAEAQHLRAVLSGDNGTSQSVSNSRKKEHHVSADSAAEIKAKGGDVDEADNNASGHRWRLLRDRHVLLLEPAAILVRDISEWLTLVARAKAGDMPLFTAGDSPQAPTVGRCSKLNTAPAATLMKRSTPANFLLGQALIKPALIAKELTGRRLGLFDDDDYKDDVDGDKSGKKIGGNTKAATTSEFDNQHGIRGNPKWHGLLSTSGRNGCSACSETFSKVFVTRGVCFRCEHRRRRLHQCPFTSSGDSNGKSSTSSSACPPSAWCPHQRRCCACEGNSNGFGHSCVACRFHCCQGGEAVVSVAEDTSPDIIFVDFDRTLCSTKSGAEPIPARHPPFDPDLLQFLVATQRRHAASLLSSTHGASALTYHQDKETPHAIQQLPLSARPAFAVCVVTRNSHVAAIEKWLTHFGLEGTPVFSVGGKQQRHGRNKADVILSVLRGQSDVGLNGNYGRVLTGFSTIEKSSESQIDEQPAKGSDSAAGAEAASTSRHTHTTASNGSADRHGNVGHLGSTYVWKGLFVDDSLAEVTSPDLADCGALQRVLFARS